MTSTPALSVVLVTPTTYATLRATVQHLRAQTVADQIELVLVLPSTGALDGDFAMFQAVQLVAAGAGARLGHAKMLGVQAARAPVVVFAEDHCYPAPAWAAALLAAHADAWAAVGPAIGNANPARAISWANLLIAYGRWLEPMESGEIDDIPGHNSSYKRAVLLGYGPALATMLEREGTLHARLRADGQRLYLAAAARAYHINPTRLAAWVPLRFNAGRLFAAARAEAGGWTAARRAVYIAGAPLIPFVRLRQILHLIARAGRQRELVPRVLPMLLLALGVHSMGEVAGYALGAGRTRERLIDFEFDRLRQVHARDRAQLVESE